MPTLKELTLGIGAERVIDAVGVDAQHAHEGPAAKEAQQHKAEFKRELQEIAPEQHPKDGNWIPGDAPSQALSWAVEAVAKTGTFAIIGVYPPAARVFPIGEAMNKNLTVNMGNRNHRKYIPDLVELVRTGAIVPSQILSKVEPLTALSKPIRLSISASLGG